MKRSDLYRVVQQTLRNHAIENRGRLAPPRLQHLGVVLVDVLLDDTSHLLETATMLVEQGLALSSVMAAAAAIQRTLLHASETERALHVADRLAHLAVAMTNADTAGVLQSQEAIRGAVIRVVNQQRAEIEQQRTEAERLTSLVYELSTPIVPVYHGILVLPLIGSIDSRRSMDVTDRLLHKITDYSADCVIIDITGVPVVDTAVAQHLLQTARAANLLGTLVVLTGISPEIAQTIVQLGIELQGVRTLRDLEAGITYALQRRNLAIRQIA